MDDIAKTFRALEVWTKSALFTIDDMKDWAKEEMSSNEFLSMLRITRMSLDFASKYLKELYELKGLNYDEIFMLEEKEVNNENI